MSDRDGPAQPPEEESPPTVGAPATSAGGLEAILSTTRWAMRPGALRGAKLLLAVNQEPGFDCPGCAWPEPRGDHRASLEFCENGAKHVLDEATTLRAGPDLFARMSIAELAAKPDQWLNAQGRLTHPMLLEAGASHYAPVTWERAFEVLAEELGAMASPDEAVFYTSGRTSNEAAFLYQLYVRQLGTNNLPDCSNMCHESSGLGLTTTIGVGKGTVTLDDFELCDAIFVIGQNPGTNHPRMLSALEAAARRGAAIVSINPLREAGLLRFVHPQDAGALLGRGTELTSLFLQVRVNGDVALLKGIMKEMLEEEARAPGTVLDRDFLDAHTAGFDAFAAELADASWDRIVEDSGVPRAEIARAARVAMRARRTIVCWAMGITQHRNGVANVQEIVNFLLLRGNLGRPGAGACPVRGHSNVQGDRTMGIWERMPDPWLDRLGAEFGFEPPRAHGYDTVAAIRAMDRGDVRVFFALGGNFLSAAPDTEVTARALRRCRLTVQVSTKPNRSHLVVGRRALILPCLGRTERDAQAGGDQFVTVEDSMGVVHASRGRLAPASPELLSEPAIVARLAKATLGARSQVGWDALVADYDRIREHIARVVPGFEDMNARVRQRGGFVLRNAARERDWRVPGGRARFTVNPMPRHELAPGQLLMMTIRSHDQFNTVVYAPDDRYRGIRGGRRVVFLNPDDMAAFALREGELVDLVGHFRGEERVARRFAVVPYDLPRRSAATYYPEANVLIALEDHAAGSFTPSSKSVVISLRR